MRKNIVAGNWKMNTTVTEGINLAIDIIEGSKGLSNVELIVAPPFTHLVCVGEKLKDSKICLASQNCAEQEKGAYTGEISAAMLAEIGVKYAIIGHSERRQYYGETGEILLKKVKIALSKGIAPIYCVGEKLEDRESNKHFEIVEQQLKEVIGQLDKIDFENIIIAYEPVWAIGTEIGRASCRERVSSTV